MGQQQLLLLVLSTVIVGLATVAGIQAFSENQAQAAQDALVQRGTSIASDLKGLQGKPSQLGGIDLTSTTNEEGAAVVLGQLGYEKDLDDDGTVDDGTTVTVDGAAGSGANCDVTLNHGSDTSTDADIECNSSEANQTATVTLDLDADPQVSTDFS